MASPPAPAASDPVVQVRQGTIAQVVLQRPRALNALSAAVIAQLTAAAQQLAAAPARCVLLRGSGERAFAAGADVAAMRGLDVPAARALSEAGQACMAAWAALPIPTVAVVQGFALGGGLELALSCDIILATTCARFGLPEVGLGLIPGFGGTHRLAQRVGLGTALAWILGGEPVDAAEAHRVGLVQAVYPGEALEAGVQAWSDRLLSRSAAAQGRAKALVRAARGPSAAADRAEAEAFAQLLGSAQGQEGVAAFCERRPPAFAHPKP